MAAIFLRRFRRRRFQKRRLTGNPIDRVHANFHVWNCHGQRGYVTTVITDAAGMFGGSKLQPYSTIGLLNDS